MARDNTALQVNGHSFADGKAEFNGRELPGITAITLTKNQTKTNNYGLGKNPVSRSRGKVEFSGSIEMDYATGRLLADLSSEGTLDSVPPGIFILTLENEDGTTEITRCTAFEFMADGVDMSEGDENVTFSTDIIFGTMQKTTL